MRGLARYGFRPGRPQDGPGLLRVHRRSILALGRACYSEAEVESWAAGLVTEGYGRAMTEGGERFTVALGEGGVIVGFCSVKADEVAALYVDPDCARLGLGRDLLRRAERDIAAAGHGRVRVGASLTGQAFYEAQGYRAVRRRDWQTRGGLEIEVLDMEKEMIGGDRNPGRDGS